MDNKKIVIHFLLAHSVRKLLAGFEMAALIA
jgi:hypothetical protein